MSNIGNDKAWETKYCSIDFPSKLPDDVTISHTWHPYTPPDPFGGHQIGCPPKKGLSDIDFTKYLEEYMKKQETKKVSVERKSDREKLAYILGRIEAMLTFGNIEDRESLETIRRIILE